MNRSRTHRAVSASLTTLAVGTVLLAGCSSSGSDTASTPAAAAAVAKDETAAKLVPADIAKKGVLRVASDATYPPLESVASDGSTVVGADADLAAAIGRALGLKTQVVNFSFDSIIPALQGGKFDMGMSGFNDTKERQAAVDFVDYYRGGSSFFVKASGGPAITSLDDLCGKKVSVEKGTTQQDDANAQSKKCTAAGKPAVTVLAYPDQNATNLALSSGRADVSIADSPVAAYAVKQSDGEMKLAGTEYGVVLHGIALPKGSGLTKAVQAAVQSLIKSGAYQKIMKKWGIADDDTVSSVSINGG